MLDNARIAPYSTALMNTGVCVRLPQGCYGRLAARSSAVVAGLDVRGGVVDRDYTGPIQILVANTTGVEKFVAGGSSVAQLICERIRLPVARPIDDNLCGGGSGCGAARRKRGFRLVDFAGGLGSDGEAVSADEVDARPKRRRSSRLR